MANIPTPPRSKIRSFIPNRTCTKPESKAKEKIEGVNTDIFFENFARKTKNTTTGIETEINKICRFVKRDESSASPCAETIGRVRTNVVNVKRYLIALCFILHPPGMLCNL